MSVDDRKQPHPFDVEVGKRVMLRRRELGLSQTELAQAVGLTFQQIQKYERGANRISASRLSEIAATLDVSRAWLMGEGPSPQGDALALLDGPDALDLLRDWATLSKSGRQVVRQLIRELAEASRTSGG